MASPLRTNPAYAHLAYQKSIKNREIVFLRRTYLGDEVTDPREVLVCEEVFPQDSKVPQEAIQHRIEELTEEVAALEIELRRFELVPRNGQGHNEQKRQKDSGKPHSKSHSSHGKGGRAN
jgi:hypothetical protein